MIKVCEDKLLWNGALGVVSMLYKHIQVWDVMVRHVV